MPARWVLVVGGALAVLMLGLAAAAWLGVFGDRGGPFLWVATFLALQGAALFVGVLVAGRSTRGSGPGTQLDPPG